MQPLLWTLICLVAYVCGLVIIVKMTPMLLSSPYYEGMFMGVAAADVIGGILAYGAMVVSFYLFNGAFAVRVLDFLFLAGIFVVGLALARQSIRPRASGYRSSRIVAGLYCGLLALAAILSIVFLFTAPA
jgi:hypothetical protein